MAISRNQLVKELEPGLNALFGLEYNRYENQHEEIFTKETSDRAFEEEVMLSGFGNAGVKPEGSAVTFDNAQETYTSRYQHETVALAFSITEEAIEDNLYDRLSSRYTKALARSMANTKQIKAANVLNRAFNSSYTGGDGKELCATDHPLATGGTFSNELATAADLNETSLEQSLIDIASFVDERGLKIAAQGRKLIIPKELQFTAERLMKSELRTGTADNDINPVKSMGLLGDGQANLSRITSNTAWWVQTDAPEGLKLLMRRGLEKSMEGDFATDSMRYKATERYTVGWTDPRAVFGTPGV